MPSSEKIAIAAHLHVLLRRKTGRVTDTEWMATNQEYAAEITRFAREKAAEEGHLDIAAWADKLEEIMQLPEPKARVPLVKMMSNAARDHAPLSPESAERTGSRVVNTDEGYPESGFIESTLGSSGGGDGAPKPKEPGSGSRYVKGLR